MWLGIWWGWWKFEKTCGNLRGLVGNLRGLVGYLRRLVGIWEGWWEFERAGGNLRAVAGKFLHVVINFLGMHNSKTKVRTMSVFHFNWSDFRTTFPRPRWKCCDRHLILCNPDEKRRLVPLVLANFDEFCKPICHELIYVHTDHTPDFLKQSWKTKYRKC